MKTKLTFALALVSISMFAQPAPEFHPLRNADKQIIITNAEFSSQSGRKLIFKDIDSGARKAIDVMQVETAALVKLNISPDSAIRKQEEIDSAKSKTAEYYAQQAAILRAQQKIQDQKNAELIEQRRKEAALNAEIQAEKDKQEEDRRLEVERNRADIENTKALTRSINRNP